MSLCMLKFLVAAYTKKTRCILSWSRIHRYHHRPPRSMYSSMRLKIECSLGGNLNFSSCGVWMVIWPHQAQLWISTSAPGDTCTILFLCKNMPKRGFQTILVYMLPWSTLRGLSFSQFDQRTHRFNLQSIEVSYCDWGAAKRLMPSCSSLSALTTRTGAPDRRPSGPSFRPETGTPKIPEFILFSGWRVFLPKFFDKKAITVLPDPHMKHSLESGPLLGLWKYLPWPGWGWCCFRFGLASWWRVKAPMRLLVENFEVFETVVFFETVRMVDCMGWGWQEGCKMPCGIEGQLPTKIAFHPFPLASTTSRGARQRHSSASSAHAQRKWNSHVAPRQGITLQ